MASTPLWMAPPLSWRKFHCITRAAGAGSLPIEWKKEQQRRRRRKKIAGVDQELLDPWLLADDDSRFAEYNGVQVHHKISKAAPAEEKMRFPAILLHGFGASVFSWERVLASLSSTLGAAALAFDRPGFGLTSRVFSSGENPYSIAFSAALTLAFVDFLQAEKAILIGHSAGCIVAAEAYLRNPERVAAIIMLAPAIVAPFFPPRSETTDTGTPPIDFSNPLKFVASLFTRLFFAVASRLVSLMKFMQRVNEAAVAFYCRLVSAVLRSRTSIWLIQEIMDRFGEKVVRLAWYKPENADDYVIRGYTKPLGCRHWERALLEYVISLLASRRSGRKLAERLGEISCPVLVITGDADRLVPAWNAKKLAGFFQKSRFHMINQCGHLPHEEKPDEVLKAIREFVTSLNS